MKILVRNLSRNTTEAELRKQFEAFGKVQSCTLVMDPKTKTSKGFGFVTMVKPGESKAAMKQLNGSKLDGNTIRVKRAEDKRPDEKGAEEKGAEEKREIASNPPDSVWDKGRKKRGL